MWSWADECDSTTSGDAVTLRDIAQTIASLVHECECPDERKNYRFEFRDTAVELVFLHRQLLISVTSSQREDAIDVTDDDATIANNSIDVQVQTDNVDPISVTDPADPVDSTTPVDPDDQIHVFLDNVHNPDYDHLTSVSDKAAFKEVASNYSVCYGVCPKTNLMYTIKNKGTRNAYVAVQRPPADYDMTRLESLKDDAKEYQVKTNESTWHETDVLATMKGLRSARMYVKMQLLVNSPPRWFHIRSSTEIIDYWVREGILYSKTTQKDAQCQICQLSDAM